MEFYHSTRLGDDLERGWRDFARAVPCAHYMGDPLWGRIEASEIGPLSPQPHYFWATENDEVCLTAVGLRRPVPISRRGFWEFHRCPTFADPAGLDQWLDWLMPTIHRDAARMRIGPTLPLPEGGDDTETILERHGFTRHRMMGTWDTLWLPLEGDDDAILASFRRQTRQAIRKCERMDVVVSEEDTPEGRTLLHEMQTEMASRAPVERTDPHVLDAISRLWLLGGAGGTVLVARHAGEPRAAALVVLYHDWAHLSLLPSSKTERGSGSPPASHLLVWEAIRWANARGCSRFDMGGYSLTAREGDALWGVNQFKRGFAPEQLPSKSVAIHEIVTSPVLAVSARFVRRAQRARNRQRTPAAD
jgi:hypothetical protein